MKICSVLVVIAIISSFSSPLLAQSNATGTTAAKKAKSSKRKQPSKNLYIDVHHLGKGKVTAKDVEAAHQKDLAVQKKYGVDLTKYWFDEANGDVYCLSSSANTESIKKTHAEAHGLLPQQIYKVTDGHEAPVKGGGEFFLDVHELGAGNVTAKAVAGAHEKDLATQTKYGVNFINYWVNEKEGKVMCLSQAKDSTSIINTHKEAHGLIPNKVIKVKQGE